MIKNLSLTIKEGYLLKRSSKSIHAISTYLFKINSFKYQLLFLLYYIVIFLLDEPKLLRNPPTNCGSIFGHWLEWTLDHCSTQSSFSSRILVETAHFRSLLNILIGLRLGLGFVLFKSLTLLFLSCSLQQCLVYLGLLFCCMTHFLLRLNSHTWNWHFHENLPVFFTIQYTFLCIMTVQNQSCLREM